MFFPAKNEFSTIFDDKQQAYRLYYYLIPRLKWKKISYIKKKKKQETEEIDLSAFAKNKNISVRELKNYIQEYE